MKKIYCLLILLYWLYAPANATDTECIFEKPMAADFTACIIQSGRIDVIKDIPPELDTSALPAEFTQHVLLGHYHIDIYQLSIEKDSDIQTPWQFETRIHESLYPPTYPKIRFLDIVEVNNRLFVFYTNSLFINIQVLQKDTANQWQTEMLLPNLARSFPDDFSKSIEINENNNGSYTINSEMLNGTARRWRYMPGKGIKAL